MTNVFQNKFLSSAVRRSLKVFTFSTLSPTLGAMTLNKFYGVSGGLVNRSC